MENNCEYFVPNDNREQFIEEIRPYLDALISNIGRNPDEYTYEAISSIEYIQRSLDLVKDSTIDKYFMLEGVRAAATAFEKVYVDPSLKRISIFTDRLASSIVLPDDDQKRYIKTYLDYNLPRVSKMLKTGPVDMDTLIHWLRDGYIYGSPSGLYEWLAKKIDVVRDIADNIIYSPVFVINRKELPIDEVCDMILKDNNLNSYALLVALCEFYLEKDGLLICEVAIDEYDGIQCIFIEPTMENLDALHRLVNLQYWTDMLDVFKQFHDTCKINLENLSKFLDEYTNNSGKDENTND